MTRHLADKWLRKAEKLAGVEPQKDSLWHAYRRKWATERKHLSDTDVAAAGGWQNSLTLRKVYQQSDAETMLLAVLGGSELWERKKWGVAQPAERLAVNQEVGGSNPPAPVGEKVGNERLSGLWAREAVLVWWARHGR